MGDNDGQCSNLENGMEYRGYIGEVEFDESIGMLHGRLINVKDLITFDTDRADQVEVEFKAAVDDYIAWCKERGEKPEKPYSGEFRVRVGVDLHRSLAIAAASVQVSLNTYIKERLAEAVPE